MRTSTFTIISAVAASITAIKHDGKAHHHVRPRQDESTSTTAAVTNSLTSMTNTAVSSYNFPTTVIQVPVATVCPDTPSSSAAFSILPIPSLPASSSSNSSTNLSSVSSVRVNATALLPNGSSTLFLSTTTTTRSMAVGVVATNTSTATATQLPTLAGQKTDAGTATATARIILDSNGCQTVYSAKTTALCTTTLHPAGMLPVHVTECDQWVTFSSEKLDGCSATTSATAATDANTLTASTPTSSDTAPPDPSITGPTAFYVAHWYDLAHSPNVPSVVRVEDCLPLTTGLSCLTSSESWSVVRSTSTRTGTSLAAFSGPAIITSGTYTATTTLSFESTVTTTSLVTLSSIMRNRLVDDGDAADSEGSTVTVAVTTPTTVTLSLESVGQTTVTVQETSTLEVTQTMTRTRTGVGSGARRSASAGP